MPLHSASNSSPHLQMVIPRQQLEASANTAYYTRQDLPEINSVSQHPQSSLQMGERLIAHAANIQHDAMVSLATRPTGLEGLELISQISPSPDHMSLTSQQAGLTSEQTLCVLNTGVRTLDGLIAEQLQNASPESKCALRQQVPAVEALVDGDFPRAQRIAAGTDAAVMVEHLAEHFYDNPQSPPERAQVLLNFYSSVLRNQFQDDGAGWAASIHNVVLRDLATVGLTTTLRQLAGMALESHFILEGLAPTSRQLIGASVMLLGPCLNLLGVVRDEMNGSATGTSRLSRAAMLGLSLGVLGAASAVNPPGPLSQLASFATQATIYTTLRDLMQLFIPLKDNVTSLSVSSTAMAGLGYGANQAVASLLMDKLSPHSGAGYPMGVAANIESTADTLLTTLLAQSTANTASTASTTDVRTQIVSAIEALRPHLSHDVIRGLINTLAEVGDDLLRPAIARHREVQRLITTTRNEAIAEGRDPEEAVNSIPAQQRQGLRIYFDTARVPIVGSGFPTTKQFLDQLLTTNAMRTSMFQAIMGATLTAGTVLGKLGMSATQQDWAGYGVAAAIIQIGYTPFLFAHTTRTEPPAQSRADSDDRIGTPDPDASVPTHLASDDDVCETRF
ncbi:hypothetical protein EMIT0324P_170032 [Pseudomonas chlororaphis]|uniref:hypothetical protein n=1 Tax=Pseudomonas chlororaphis TaxID=587753 RepID=UPI0039E47FAF